ncbi:uncharacterized protein LOC115885178 [Sitophilus oryzae]|uniref:Uncharacterized protein LOC115885178 n=1 Tax=Sitophilus oryzae TaxID=7048 RepID=A0A6J2Y7Q9_SITOR|nr:uncharacterized protein LOC115885178 [Sitophilus oryzae]
MGCSAAKNVTALEQADNGRKHANPNQVGDAASGLSSSINELIESHIEDLENANVDNIQKGATGLAFDITFEENDNIDESVQKQPPKRLLEMQDTQSSPVTLQKLQEKLDEAEIRRQQILQQRVESAKRIRPKFHYVPKEESQSPNHLNVPSIPTEESPVPSGP